MLHKKELKPNGFRELTEEEMLAVSGGYFHEQETVPGLPGGEGGFGGPQMEYFRSTGIWIDNPNIASAALSYSSGSGYHGAEGGVPHTIGNPIVVTADRVTPAEINSIGQGQTVVGIGDWCSDAQDLQEFGSSLAALGAVVGLAGLATPWPDGEVAGVFLAGAGGIIYLVGTGINSANGC